MIKQGSFIWPDRIKTPDLREYLCDNASTILDSKDVTFQRYLKNKYNNNRVNLNDILAQEYLVIDTRQSDLRTYKGKTPTLRTGRHGILYVKNGELHKLSGFESLLLQGFDKDKAAEATEKMTEQQILSQAGNAMTVSAIEQVSKQLLEYSEREY
jgi:DNA (cytosine-5)-methyltransferase 1